MKAILQLIFVLLLTVPALAAPYSEKPTRWTPELQEYESTDRSSALQVYSNGQEIVRDRRGLESVAEYLLRHLILQVDYKDLTKVIPDRNPESAVQDVNQKKIWAVYKHFTQEGYNVDPFNTFVRYADIEKTTVQEVVFEKPAVKASVKHPASSPVEMLGTFASSMSETLKSGYFPYYTRRFADVQKDHTSIVRTNMAGRRLRIAGVDQSYEIFLLKQIESSLAQKGYSLVAGFYYGSRVMTRDLVIKFHPEAAEYLGMTKGQLMKNKIRESGLTSVSDLELFLVAKPLVAGADVPPEHKSQAETTLRDDIRTDLNAATRRYSMGLKVLVAKQSETEYDAFKMIQDEMTKKNQQAQTKSWIASPEQYSQFFPSRDIISCQRVFGAN